MCFPFISEVLAFTTSMPSLPTELPLVQKGELSIAVKKAWCSYGKSPLLIGKWILDICIYVGEKLEVSRNIEEPWVFLSYTGGGFGGEYGKDRAVKPIIKSHTHGFASHTYFGLFRGCKILWNHVKWFLPAKNWAPAKPILGVLWFLSNANLHPSPNVRLIHRTILCGDPLLGISDLLLPIRRFSLARVPWLAGSKNWRRDTSRYQLLCFMVSMVSMVLYTSLTNSLWSAYPSTNQQGIQPWKKLFVLPFAVDDLIH